MASDDDIMSFDEYCFDVLDIADTDFLSRAEWDKYYEMYENYLKSNFIILQMMRRILLLHH